MADPKQNEEFKVVDRRLFTQEGELRKDVAEQHDREEESAAKASRDTQAAAKGAPLPQPGSSNNPSETVAPTDSPGSGTPDSEPKASRGFQMLVDFITRNAAAMLGGMADPRTGQPFLDLEGAREMIDMLDVLREKTRGNLAKADDDLLIEVIGSLKLTYMEVSKAAAEAMAKKAKAKP